MTARELAVADPRTRPLLAVTPGDPHGIGPEVAMAALAGAEASAVARCVLVCDARIAEAAARVAAPGARLRVVGGAGEAAGEPGWVDVLDTRVDLPLPPAYGTVSPAAGRAALRWIEAGVDLAMKGQVDGVVTGPIHKEAIHQAGCPHPGHTEIFKALTGAQDVRMLLLTDELRVVHVSTHVSLREACERATRARVRETIRQAAKVMRQMGIAAPRVAVAGLNPHAGEGGLFGREEIEEIAPAVQDARAEGIDAQGPLPADTLFSQARAGLYDVVVAMYHDQGHIPVKTLGFRMDPHTRRWLSVSGVNVTLGLPIIRTSVDHGTAFDQAGKGTASHASLLDAIQRAAQMAATSAGSGRTPA